MIAENLTSYCFEELEVGMTAEYHRVINESDVKSFANLSGDINPLHLDTAYAEKTMFKGRIVHGAYTAALISAVIGTKLPGPGCIYISQQVEFKAPVYIGDTVIAVAKIIKLIGSRKRAIINTNCMVGKKIVLVGEAIIQVPTFRQLSKMKIVAHHSNQ